MEDFLSFFFSAYMIGNINMKLPTLYKIDNTDEIREWSISSNQNTYTITHGRMGGTLQSTTLIAKPKNIGKKNETTAEEQAILEAEALWNKQKNRKGYQTTNTPTKRIDPMLAQSYDKHSKKINWPCYIQAKMDGLRCLCIIENKKVKLLSRQNKAFTALKHIEDSVLNLNLEDCILDGELYNHDYHADFQNLVSLIKRDDPSTNTNLVQYHIYDTIKLVDFKNRNIWLNNNIKENDIIKLVPTYLLKDVSDLQVYHEKFLNIGYEGSILRNILGIYEIGKRSYNLQKYKDFEDAEFEIVDAYENVGTQSGQCTLVCVTSEGKRFGVKPKGTAQIREKYWEDFQDGKLTGKFLNVRYFGLSQDNIPRFPIGTYIREDL